MSVDENTLKCDFKSKFIIFMQKVIWNQNQNPISKKDFKSKYNDKVTQPDPSKN